jgi:carbamoyl-phosphate synthase large subunit
MKTNILVTSAGRRVELIQAFQLELKDIFSDARVYATDMNPALSPACRCADVSLSIPKVTDENYMGVLLDLCEQHHIGMVVPTIDTELQVLADYRDQFSEYGIHIIVSSADLIASCRDKRKTRSLFENVGINAPIIYNKEQIQFPCFVKPYDGSCSVDAEALLSEEQLTSSILSNEKMMFMELVDDGHTEYTVDTYFTKDGVLKCLVPRERIEVRSGEVSKGVTRRNEVYDYLLPACKSIKGARGCLTIQVFANLLQKSFYGLEINPRFGGGYPLTYSAGANYPGWLIAEYFLDEEIDFFNQWEADLLMLRYDAKELVQGYA